MATILAFPAPRLPIRSSESSLPDFARIWFDQAAIAWRESTRRRVESLLRCHVLPEFRKHGRGGFDRAALMAFRTNLVVNRGCSLSRVNAIVQVISQCLAERERQTGVPNPCRDLRRLPTRRPAVQPFSLPELRRLVEVAPDHLRDYIWFRGLTGLRSGEANGLRWDCVDLAAGTIEIRRARSDGQDRLPKNGYSERVIMLMPTLLAALQRQWERTGSADGYVFQTRRGCPLDVQNFTRRDWHRIIAAAGLAFRCPEQLRHTAATLMLAAGEAPTYVSQILGHADCRMLLSTYARYMPHALGRQDGRAFELALQRRFSGILTDSPE